jgi:hypothetical protein
MLVSDFGFVGPAYFGKTRSIDMQECVNLYLENEAGGSKKQQVLLGTPGLRRLCTLNTKGACRGMHVTSDGQLYVVNGNTLYLVSVYGTYTVIGTIGTYDGRVGIADNGNVAKELIIVDGMKGYIYNWGTGVVSEIDAEAFPENPTHVRFRNGRFVVNRGNTGQVFWSATYDGTTWGGDYQTAEGSPDNVVALHSTNDELILFGERTTEFWSDTSDPDSPFARIPSGFIDIGCGAIESVASINNDVFWLGATPGGGGIIWHTRSYSPERISNHAIEWMLHSFGDVSTAKAYCYEQTGHYFYVITFPSHNKTMCYDLSTGTWHERASYDKILGRLTQHRSMYSAMLNNRTFVGDIGAGIVWELDPNCYSDDGNEIHRIRTCPHVHQDMSRIFYNSFTLDAQKGIGLTNGQGAVPSVELQWSNDGGYTWGDPRVRSLGRQGEYGVRVKWDGLGSSRDRVFRVKISDPVEVTFIAAQVDVSSDTV